MALLGMQNTVSEIYLDILKVFSSYFNGCQNITISVSRKKYKLVENSIWNNNGFSISEKSKMIAVFNKFILFSWNRNCDILANVHVKISPTV